MDFQELRKEYTKAGLAETDLVGDPIEQFRVWFEEAVAAGIDSAEAMTLATATPDGAPSARIVLLKGFDAEGFCFFTNYGSRKGQELDANPRAALVFHWRELERQARIEGRVERATVEASEAYHRRRPRGSQLSAYASPQSEPVADRAALENLRETVEAQFPEGQPIPTPPNWGGYRVRPESIEFWQGRADRFHDRLRFHLGADGRWLLERLAP